MGNDGNILESGLTEGLEPPPPGIVMNGEEDLLGRVSALIEARRSKPVDDKLQLPKSGRRSKWEFCCSRSAVAIVIRQSEFEEFTKITCALCRRLLQHPIVLPCQHMLCLECGINLADCPTCQRSYSATTTSLANLSLPDVLAKKLDRDKQNYMAQSRRIH